jgi:hypothetical protein
VSLSARATATALAEDVRAQASAPRPAISPVETLILGNDEPEPESAVEEQLEAEPAPAAAIRPQPMREVLPEPRPEPKKRGFLGSWYGRKQEVVRTEPTPMPRQLTQPRATSQVMTRSAEPQRGQPAQADLDLNADDQFEIPAFLRRQTN